MRRRIFFNSLFQRRKGFLKVSQFFPAKISRSTSANILPTRFGNSGQLRQFLDATGRLWVNGDLIGKGKHVAAITLKLTK